MKSADLEKLGVPNHPKVMEIDGVVLNLGYIESARFAVLPFVYEGRKSRDAVDVIVDFCRVLLPYLDGMSKQKGWETPERPEPGSWDYDLRDDHYTDLLAEMMKWCTDGGWNDSFEVEIEGEEHRQSYWDWCFEKHDWNATFVPKRFVSIDSAGSLFAAFDPEVHTPELVRTCKESGEDRFVEIVRRAIS